MKHTFPKLLHQWCGNPLSSGSVIKKNATGTKSFSFVLFLIVNVSWTPTGTCTRTLILILVFIYLFTPGQRLKVNSTCDLVLVPFARPPAGTLQGTPSDFVYLDPEINCVNTGGQTKKVKANVRQNNISGLLFFFFLSLFYGGKLTIWQR